MNGFSIENSTFLSLITFLLDAAGKPELGSLWSTVSKIPRGGREEKAGRAGPSQVNFLFPCFIQEWFMLMTLNAQQACRNFSLSRNLSNFRKGKNSFPTPLTFYHLPVLLPSPPRLWQFSLWYLHLEQNLRHWVHAPCFVCLQQCFSLLGRRPSVVIFPIVLYWK